MSIPAGLKRFFSSRYGVLTAVSLGVYILADLLGEFMAGWGFNAECIRFIGCTNGFFGFDAIEHFLSGFVILLCLVIFFQRHPKWSPLTGNIWKDAFILVATVNLISVGWELVECAHDVFRLAVLHEKLYSVKLNIDLLDQPTNLDTMGDLAFNMLGSIVAALFSLSQFGKGGLDSPEA